MTVHIRPTAGLRPLQLEGIFHSSRYGVVVATPQHSGKTTGAYRWLTAQAVNRPGSLNWFVSPTYAQAMDVMRRLQRYLPKKHVKFNKGLLTAEFSNGSMIHFKSADNSESLYGPSVHAMVVDEASRVSEDSWAACRSRMVMTEGPMRIVGNKSGRSWFWELCARAKQGQPNTVYRQMTAIDAVEQGIMSQEMFDDVKRNTPPLKFEELYLLKDVDSFNPFRGYEKCVAPLPSEEPPAGFGIDPARHEDFYAIHGLDASGHWTHCDAWQETPWDQSILRVRQIVRDNIVLVDQTGMGDPHLSELQRSGIAADGYLFGPLSRQALLENLAVGIANQRLTYPQIVADELATFEYKTLPSGRTQYRCPENFHDDRVMALALAFWLITEGDNRPRITFV